MQCLLLYQPRVFLHYENVQHYFFFLNKDSEHVKHKEQWQKHSPFPCSLNAHAFNSIPGLKLQR